MRWILYFEAALSFCYVCVFNEIKAKRAWMANIKVQFLNESMNYLRIYY